MVDSEKLLIIIALMKCDNLHTKKLYVYIGFALKLPILKQGQ